jgi:periplasmic protein TonB
VTTGMDQKGVLAARGTRECGDLSHVVPLAAEHREEAADAPPIRVTNVVPFVRAQGSPTGTMLPFNPADRPAPHLIGRKGAIQFAVVLALSLAAHSGLWQLFNREPEPMASIGLEAISVEIVLGANMPAGPAVTPGEQEADSTPTEKLRTKTDERDTSTAIKETQPAEVKPVEPERPAQPAVSEATPQRSQPEVVEPAPERAEPEQAVAPQRNETAEAREPDTALPRTEPPKPEPITTEAEREPAPSPATKTREQPAPPQKTASREQKSTAPRSSAASGVGVGQSQRDTNYHGLVAAHLARHKRFPSDARSRREQGSATVRFDLDGSGRVTRVSLVRGTGSASLDREAVAMVRRASPFPPPPDRQPANFTAPVSFRIQ